MTNNERVRRLLVSGQYTGDIETDQDTQETAAELVSLIRNCGLGDDALAVIRSRPAAIKAVRSLPALVAMRRPTTC